ncbi:MAG TPA: glycosyltransferase family 2 protein [Tepidisphaeraceae bacterium]|jgi:dolichol-phosphate mannosyltransferase
MSASPPVRHLLTPRKPPGRLSIVIPVYNEEQTIPALRAALTPVLDALACDAQVILINDGSSDDTLGALADWAAEDPRVTVLCLARNFGQQAAITAGLDEASGDAIVIMDADLQDPPEVIPLMIGKYREGYDVVYARRASRTGEGPIKRLSAWAFYRLMRALVHRDLPADVGDFRLLSRPGLDALNSMRETHRFLRGMVAWVGFPQTAVEFDRPPRRAGKTNYPLRRMLAFAWTAAISFSPVPLRLSLLAGVLVGILGLADGAYALVRKITGHTVPGWTSLMVMLCLIGGGVLLSLGVLGEYVGRIFEEAKGRPLYLVSRVLNARQASAPRLAPRPALMLEVERASNERETALSGPAQGAAP